MLENLLKSLAAAKDRAVTLERSVAKKLNKELKVLPQYYGFHGLDSFIEALEASAAGTSAGKKAKPDTAIRRKRAKITADIRAGVKKLIEAGKTGAEVAKELKISLPTVQNIKKALGMVGPKKPAPRKVAVSKAPAKSKTAAKKAPVKKTPVKKAKKKASHKPAASAPAPVAANSAPEASASPETTSAKV
jgi:hypothetical protein